MRLAPEHRQDQRHFLRRGIGDRGSGSVFFAQPRPHAGRVPPRALGRTGVFAAAFVWLVLVVLTLSLPQAFHQADYYVLGGLGLAALWWVLGLRYRLKKGTARIGHIPDEQDELREASAPVSAVGLVD